MSSSLGFFFLSFQNKPCLAPHLILLDRSRCFIPHQGLLCTFPIHLTPNGIFLWSYRYGGYEGKLASHILLSQKPDPKEKQVINLDQDVQVCGYFWWMVEELFCMISLPFIYVWYGLSFLFLLLLLLLLLLL